MNTCSGMYYPFCHSMIYFCFTGEPGVPNHIISKLIYGDSIGGCVIQFSWSPPTNLDQSDISHYIVYINGTNVLSKTSEMDQNMILVSYAVFSCGTHSISVSAVDRCGRDGQKSPNIHWKT